MPGTNSLETEKISTLLIRYSIPVIIGMMVNALYNVIDRAFIGNIPGVGALALTGVGVTFPIANILLGIGMLVGMGATATMSIKLGKKKLDDAEKLIGNALTLAVLLGVLITIVGLIVKDPMLRLFGASDTTFQYANDYIIIILLGSVFNIVGFALNSTIRADGKPKVAAMTMIIGCVANIILNPIFIFGLNKGVAGAATATVISQCITTTWVLYYYTKGSSNLKLKRENLKLELRLLKMIFAIGSAPFAMQVAASFVQIIANNALKATGGDLAIGAMASISAISMMFLMPIFGLNQGSQPIIGYNYGAKKYDRVLKTYRYTTLTAISFLTVGFVIVQLFPELLLMVFNSDEELMAISVNGLRIYLFMLPLVALSVTGSTFFQSIGQAKTAMLLSLLRQLILLIPLIIILPQFIQLNGVWLAQPISDLLAGLITLIFLMKEFKRLKEAQLKCNKTATNES